MFQYQYATDSAIDDMAEEAAEWKYLERYEFTWEEIVKQICFCLSGKNSMVRTVKPWNLNALDKDIARLGNLHYPLFF